MTGSVGFGLGLNPRPVVLKLFTWLILTLSFHDGFYLNVISVCFVGVSTTLKVFSKGTVALLYSQPE